MKIKMLGAALTGALMLGATLAGAAAAASVPPRSFFIDPVTGEPNVVIAVGATANASDVVSGSLIAAAVGNMATVEETKTVTRSSSATFDNMMEYNYSFDRLAKTSNGLNFEEYNATTCTDGTKLTAKWYTDYELYSTQFWETAYDQKPSSVYDISVAIVMPREIRNPSGHVVAKELNTLWSSVSPKDWDSKDRVYYRSVTTNRKYFLVNKHTNTPNDPTYPIVRSLPAYAGGSYDNGDTTWDFDGYAFFTTKAWVDVAGDGDAYSDAALDCDYRFGGTGTAMEAHEEIQVILADIENQPDGIVDLRGDRGHASGIVYRTAEIRYPLLENGQNICGVKKCDGMVDFDTAIKGYLPKIKFLNKPMYTPMFAGATFNTDLGDNGYLGAYFAHGKPYGEKEKIMKVGDAYSFHGWTINLSDVNIYENKAFITVSGPELASPFSFIMVMDSMDEKCFACCPECAVYGGKGSFTSNPTGRNEYDPYMVITTKSKEKDGKSYDLFKYTSFMLDGIKTFVGADGTYLAEFNIYAVEDFGWFEDKGCCDPFITTPNDYGLAITGGWRKVSYDANGSDVGNGNLGWYSWEDGLAPAQPENASISEAFILWQPAPQCNTPCPDANFDTLELQLCDNIDIPDCETEFTVYGPDNYFSVTIQDVDFGKANMTLNGVSPVGAGYEQYRGYYSTIPAPPSVTQDGVYYGKANSSTKDIDGAKIKISQTTVDIAQSITYTKNVNIDPIELIKLDIEINTTSMHKNLILVGGPVYNSIVRDLGNMGASTVDWATSPGEWEWIADPFGRGYDVLIVAGANREETRLAAQQLVSQLR